MFYSGKYGDGGNGREMSFKRQRLMDQGSSFYGTSPGSSFMYNSPTPSYSYIGQPPPFPVVRLRGLPFDCSEADIADFFCGLDIVDILFVHKNEKFMGEAYCVLGYPFQIDFALQRNRQNIGRRYVEVFRSKRQEYYKAIANEVSDVSGGSPRHNVPRAKSFDDTVEHTGVIRLRGLPFSAGKVDIIDFFKGFLLSEDTIHITINSEGRPTGEAFVVFSSADDSRTAMAKDRMTIGSRYIELFPSSPEEMEDAISRGRAALDSTEWTAVLRMRGLPFSAGKDDIIEFFSDFVLSEDSIHMTMTASGRPTGEAFVEFASAEDAKAALAKDRMNLGSRYIELFPSSPSELNEAVSRGC